MVYYDEDGEEVDFPTVQHVHTTHMSGKLKCDIPWLMDEKHGIERWYNESGELECEVPYVNGVKRLDLLEKENRLERLILLGE